MYGIPGGHGSPVELRMTRIAEDDADSRGRQALAGTTGLAGSHCSIAKVVKVVPGGGAERGKGGKTQGPAGPVRLEDTSAAAQPGAALTGAPKRSTAAL